MFDIFYYVTMVGMCVVCGFLILLILIQKGRGGGLSSAFGGAGGNTAFGSKTGDVLTWATSVVFGIMLLLAVGLNLLANERANSATAGLNNAAPMMPEQAPTTEPATSQPATLP